MNSSYYPSLSLLAGLPRQDTIGCGCGPQVPASGPPFGPVPTGYEWNGHEWVPFDLSRKEPKVTLTRAPANHIWDADANGWVHFDSPRGQEIAGTSSTTFIPPATTTTTTTSTTTTTKTHPAVEKAFKHVSFSLLSTSSSSTATSSSKPFAGFFQEPEDGNMSEELADDLRSLRSQLQLRQDNLYCGIEIGDTPQIEQANKEHDSLTEKIRAIETVLQAFGQIFRTR